MTWQALPVGGGVVRTRDGRALEPGEFVTLSNCRYKAGDTVQVHNDVGSTAFGAPNNTVIAGPFLLTDESGTDRLLVVTTDGSTNSYLETATVGTTGSWSSIQTITGVVTAASAIHRGNQYFVVTDQGNYVVTNNSPRAMGMDEDTSITSTGTISIASGATNTILDGDVMFYVVTEYDSTNDIESKAIDHDYDYADNDGDEFRVRWDISGTGPLNSNADKVRIYRAYLGNGGASFSFSSDAGSNAIQTTNRKLPWVAGLIAELDYGNVDATYGARNWVDGCTYKYNPSVQYPLIETDVAYGGAVYDFLEKPAPASLGCVFNDCLVLNDPGTSKQIIRWSPPGYPEYQPVPYFMYFATEDSDEVVGLRVINDRLVVLTTGAAHRVNYLPLAGDLRGQSGRVQEPITSRVGCLGRNAHAKVETEAGEYVVWVSERGLEWSNGQGWSDACPDFTTDLISSSSPVLANNEKLYRLELYDGATRWDFYYHPSHIKGGRLKMTGPHTAPQSVTTGAVSNRTYLWVGGTSNVYTMNVGNNTADTEIVTGHLRGSNPFQQLEAMSIGLTHSGNTGTTYRCRFYGKLEGEAEADSGVWEIPNADQDETGLAELSMAGKYLRGSITVDSEAAWSVGPVWLDLALTEGGNG